MIATTVIGRGYVSCVVVHVESSETVSATNVWREEAGRFREDPTFDEFVTEIQSERRDPESDESAP